MIGLALVSFVTVFAAGLKGSIDNAIDKTITGQVIVSNNDGFSDIPAATVEAVAGVDGVAWPPPLRFTQDNVQGGAGKGSADPDRPARPPAECWRSTGTTARRAARAAGRRTTP